MPSLAFTPAALRLSGADIVPQPVRFGFTPATLRLVGGPVMAGPSLSTDLTDLSAVLDTLFSSEAIVDAQGRPTRRLQQIWENAIGGIKAVLEGQGLSINELRNLYAALNTAQTTAAAAAQQAQAADDAKALEQSYVDPLGCVTASSSGLVSIAGHTRIYGDGTSVAVDAGSVGGFTPGVYVTVYYNDPARSGGAVTYLGTTGLIGQTGSTHIVGQVTIPAAGAPDASGSTTTPPGYNPKLPDTGI